MILAPVKIAIKLEIVYRNYIITTSDCTIRDHFRHLTYTGEKQTIHIPNCVRLMRKLKQQQQATTNGVNSVKSNMSSSGGSAPSSSRMRNVTNSVQLEKTPQPPNGGVQRNSGASSLAQQPSSRSVTKPASNHSKSNGKVNLNNQSLLNDKLMGSGSHSSSSPTFAKTDNNGRLNQESYNQLIRGTVASPSPASKQVRTVGATQEEQEPNELGIRQKSQLAPPSVPSFMQTELAFKRRGGEFHGQYEPALDDEFFNDAKSVDSYQSSTINAASKQAVPLIIRPVNRSMTSMIVVPDEPDSSDLPRNHFYNVDVNLNTELPNRSLLKEPAPSSEGDAPSHGDVSSSVLEVSTESNTTEFETTVTNKLIDQFFHEQLIEHGIMTDVMREGDDLLRYETHCIMDTRNEESIIQTRTMLDQEDEKNRKMDTDKKKDKQQNKAMSMMQAKTLEAEIQYIEYLIGCQAEEQVGVDVGIHRVEQDIGLTRQLIQNQQDRETYLKEIANHVESEETGKQIGEMVMEHNTNSTISYNIFKMKESVNNTSEKLVKITKEIEELEEWIRRETIYQVHRIEMMKQRLAFNRKWYYDAKQLENKALRDLELTQHETLKLKRQYDHAQKLFKYVEKEEGADLVKNLERVVRMLKGKEEMPNGTYISVSRALDLYTQLKDAATRNEFTVPFFKKFLKDHREFGIFIDDVEPLPDLYDEPEEDLSMTGYENGYDEEEEEEDQLLLDRVTVPQVRPFRFLFTGKEPQQSP